VRCSQLDLTWLIPTSLLDEQVSRFRTVPALKEVCVPDSESPSPIKAEDLIALAKTLRADTLLDDAKRLLTIREFDCWKRTEIDGFTATAAGEFLGLSVRSVMYALRRARLAIGEWYIQEREGAVRLGLTIAPGGSPRFAADATMTSAHRSTRSYLTTVALDGLGDILIESEAA
jgi:hypothetical protein